MIKERKNLALPSVTYGLCAFFAAPACRRSGRHRWLDGRGVSRRFPDLIGGVFLRLSGRRSIRCRSSGPLYRGKHFIRILYVFKTGTVHRAWRFVFRFHFNRMIELLTENCSDSDTVPYPWCFFPVAGCGTVRPLPTIR